MPFLRWTSSAKQWRRQRTKRSSPDCSKLAIATARRIIATDEFAPRVNPPAEEMSGRKPTFSLRQILVRTDGSGPGKTSRDGRARGGKLRAGGRGCRAGRWGKAPGAARVHRKGRSGAGA